MCELLPSAVNHIFTRDPMTTMLRPDITGKVGHSFPILAPRNNKNEQTKKLQQQQQQQQTTTTTNNNNQRKPSDPTL